MPALTSSSNTAIHALAEPSRLPDEVAKVLIERIETGAYPPGSKLPPMKLLAEAFHVSTPIVREALSRLKYDGFVEPRQGSGVYVKDRTLGPPSLRLCVTPGDEGERLGLAEVFEVRLLVEQACASVAAQRRQARDVQSLRQALDDIRTAMAQGGDATEADVRFHLAVAAATQNKALHRLTGFLHGALRASVRTARDNSIRTPGLSAHAEAEHEAIFSAIEQRQPAAARQAMRAHLQGAARRLGLPPVAGAAMDQAVADDMLGFEND